MLCSQHDAVVVGKLASVSCAIIKSFLRRPNCAMVTTRERTVQTTLLMRFIIKQIGFGLVKYAGLCASTEERVD